jgi:hypothetical protein
LLNIYNSNEWATDRCDCRNRPQEEKARGRNTAIVKIAATAEDKKSEGRALGQA